mmetsp:Transcript_97865/g.253080  ORF Transcript_97865/g.253080 Transcript_97865/m.253080 type:complete len:234 (+) Transcript_97865:565-1266(+)
MSEPFAGAAAFFAMGAAGGGAPMPGGAAWPWPWPIVPGPPGRWFGTAEVGRSGREAAFAEAPPAPPPPPAGPLPAALALGLACCAFPRPPLLRPCWGLSSSPPPPLGEKGPLTTPRPRGVAVPSSSPKSPRSNLLAAALERPPSTTSAWLRGVSSPVAVSGCRSQNSRQRFSAPASATSQSFSAAVALPTSGGLFAPFWSSARTLRVSLRASVRRARLGWKVGASKGLLATSA